MCIFTESITQNCLCEYDSSHVKNPSELPEDASFQIASV